MHCTNGWLFHEWKKNKCSRCGVTYRGKLTDVMLADDPCLFEGHVQVHPAGPASRRGSVAPLLRLVPARPVEDDSSSATSAGDLVS